jgi:DNA-binding CsgD family transcriptional regulator
VPLALYVFRDARLAYANKAGVLLTARLSQQHGIEMSVLLQDQVRHLAAHPGQPDAVVLLTAPSSETFWVHIAMVSSSGRDTSDHLVTVREIGGDRETFARRYRLSAREGEVVALVLRGYSNQDIATALGFSLATAKKHLTHIFDKVGVDSRTQLISRLG